MKRISIALSLLIVALFILSSCTLDFSHEIDSSIDELNNTIKDDYGPLLKEDEKFSSSDTSSDTDKITSTDESNSTEDTSTDEDEGNVGTEIGERCPSVSLEAFDETGLLGEKFDVSKSGKATVINFWGVWCPFCLDELPYFNEIASEYAGEVSFFAIHTVDYFEIDGGGIDYVNSYYQNSEIVFLKDENTTGGMDDCYATLGGNGYYPYTLILDENGIITYKATGKISEATLRQEIEKALS